MPITRRTRRRLNPLARRLAELHNEAYLLSVRLLRMSREAQKYQEKKPLTQTKGVKRQITLEE